MILNIQYKFIFFAFISLIISFPVFPQDDTPYIKVLSPNGGENWEANSTQIIKWESKNISNLKIEYSLSDGLDWIIINSSVEASAGEYSWSIPYVQRSEVLIRISDASNQDVYDMNNETFSIYIQSNKNKSQKLNKPSQTTSTTIKIMPLGNSITWGINPDDANSPGYRRSLYFQLINAGYNVDFIGIENGGLPNDFDRDNEGHPGWSAGAPVFPGNKSLDTALSRYLRTNHPDIILLHIGTNDLSETASGYSKTGAQTAHVVRKLLDTIHTFDSNIKVIVAKIIDRADDLTKHNKTITFNNVLPDTINSLSYHDKISIVDMYSALGNYFDHPTTDTNFTYLAGNNTNLLHPNSKGYQTMANTWFNALTGVLSLPIVRVRVFLQGPYNGGQMTTALTKPTTSTYSDSRTVAANVTSIPSSITDWVQIQLRSTYNGAAVISKSVLLNKNGYIVSDDGKNQLYALDVTAGNYYYIVIKHRNHLTIMSKDSILLSSNSVLYDFTSAQTTAFPTKTIPSAKPMADLGSGKFGMYAGDMNQDKQVTTTDYTLWFNSAFNNESGYKTPDCDLNGHVTTSDYTLWYNNAFLNVSSKVP